MLFSLVMILIRSRLTRTKGYREKYPSVIQFPITAKCNSRCVMCNVWKMDHKNEMTADEIGRYMKDPIFKNVHSVGINGGEPSLINELPQIAEQVLTLPKIKSFNIITNGLNKEALLEKVEKISSLCRKRKIGFHLSFSLDGYEQIHNKVRGVKNAFGKTTQTIERVLINKERYCDSIDIACTIVKQNVENLVELDTFACGKKYPMKYRLGIENKRIDSDKHFANYSVLHDPQKRQAAIEFIHRMIFKAKSLNDKFKYFSIFYFLTDKTHKRLLGCMWQEEGITLDAKGNMYYCAVASKKIGSLREGKGNVIFFDEENLAYRNSIIKTRCRNCIHDYSGKPHLNDILLFVKMIVFNKIWPKIYKMKLLWL